jgi:hypothetical protein
MLAVVLLLLLLLSDYVCTGVLTLTFNNTGKDLKVFSLLAL